MCADVYRENLQRLKPQRYYQVQENTRADERVSKRTWKALQQRHICIQGTTDCCPSFQFPVLEDKVLQ